MAIGRRTDLTPALQERICKLIRDNGMYLEPAAAACGVAHATLYEWLARGRVRSNSTSTLGLPGAIEPGTRGLGDPEGLYEDFVDAINKAEGELEVIVVSDAVKKFKKSRNPLAPIIFASRRFRDRWSEQIQVANAGREAVAAMERYKAAWDAPEVVEGEYEVIQEGTTPELEANESHNRHSANQSEASGFHVPSPGDLDALDAQVVETTDDEDADQDGGPDDIEGQAPMRPPAAAASLPTPLPRLEKVVYDDTTPAEVSKVKSEE